MSQEHELPQMKGPAAEGTDDHTLKGMHGGHILETGKHVSGAPVVKVHLEPSDSREPLFTNSRPTAENTADHRVQMLPGGMIETGTDSIHGTPIVEVTLKPVTDATPLFDIPAKSARDIGPIRRRAPKPTRSRSTAPRRGGPANRGT